MTVHELKVAIFDGLVHRERHRVRSLLDLLQERLKQKS